MCFHEFGEYKVVLSKDYNVFATFLSTLLWYHMYVHPLDVNIVLHVPDDFIRWSSLRTQGGQREFSKE